MLSVGKCDPIYPDWQVPNDSFMPNIGLIAYCYKLVIWIKSAWPNNVISLSGAYCTTFERNNVTKNAA